MLTLIQFLSTLSLRRATTGLGVGLYLVTISIHALLAESDMRQRRIELGKLNFYPRSPCGERHREHHKHLISQIISIHALLAESDLYLGRQNPKPGEFLSTLSLRRATANWFDLWGWAEYFYPRSPCGERRPQPPRGKSSIKFLSTLSLRRATRYGRPIDVQFVFLSTLSLRRATNWTHWPTTRLSFLSTLSLRRATGSVRGISSCTAISIHALLAESDYIFKCSSILLLYFYPRSPCGERQKQN